MCPFMVRATKTHQVVDLQLTVKQTATPAAGEPVVHINTPDSAARELATYGDHRLTSCICPYNCFTS